MTTATPRRRLSAAVLLGAGLVAALAGCGSTGSAPAPGPGTTTGPGIDVAAQVQDQLAATGMAADPGSLTCPGVLAPEVGSTVSCSLTSEGQPVGLEATVASVDGTRADIEVSTQARAMPRELLAERVGDRVASEIGQTPATTCQGDLEPTVGASTTCTVGVAGATRDLRVTVASVEGGSISYSIG